MGKRLRITAVFSDVDAANNHMAKRNNDAVVVCFGPFVFLADKYDHGLSVAKAPA
jgi:predicted solute-binding protein